MATLLLLVAGFLQLVSIDSAPTKTGADRISSNIFFSEEDRPLYYSLTLNQKQNAAKIPAVQNRFPALDDNRQNWGILVNGSIYDENDNTDYNRPITILRPTKSISTENISTKQTMQTGEPPQNAPAENKLTEKITKAQLTTLRKEASSFCDIALITCCINELDLDSCVNASRCLKLKNSRSNICANKIVYGALMRVKDQFS